MKKRLLPCLTLLAFTTFLTSCSSTIEQPIIIKLDPAKYAGEWHEIGRLPNRFEKDVVAAKATYGVREIAGLSVKNEGLKVNGEKTQIQGAVTQPDPKQPGKLEVRFQNFPANLFKGDYWILALSQDYTRAMVGSPNQKYLWLLSKRKNSQKENFADFIKTAEKLGYNSAKIYWNPKRL